MGARAMLDLRQLRDPDLIGEVSRGLALVAENAAAMERSANKLVEAAEPRGARILLAAGEEEAAKYLILLDAIRCPRTPPDLLTTHLQKFNDHLAKVIYAESVG